MSAEDRNEELIQANTKKLEVPTFSKKEVEGIVIETAKKDDTPLGYQIINLEITSDGITDSEDKKLLEKLSEDEKLNKPILFHIHDTLHNLEIISGSSIVDNMINITILDPTSDTLYGYHIYLDEDDGLKAIFGSYDLSNI